MMKVVTMTGLSGVKRWWSNNPVMACGLSSLGLIAFLFLFPFFATLAGLASAGEVVVSWMSTVGAVWFNFMDGNFKLYFAVTGFFFVFFFCLMGKKPSSKAVYASLVTSMTVLVLSVLLFIMAWLYSSDYQGVTQYIDSLDESAFLLGDADRTAYVCGVTGGEVVEAVGLPSSGRKVFICEKNEDGRKQVAKRGLSEVNWIEQACNLMFCRGDEWKAHYSESQQGIVFETSTNMIRACQTVLRNLPNLTHVTLNGKPADPAQCGYGTNTIQAVYSPSWLKE